jgi:hypothetical protein
MNSNPSEGSPQVFTSKEALLAKQFTKRFLEKGKIDEEILTSDEKIKEILIEKNIVKEGDSVEEVIRILRQTGAIPEVSVSKKSENSAIKKEPEFIPIQTPETRGLKIVQDEALEENLSSLYKQFERDAIFENEEEFDSTYTKILSLEKNREEETEEYYYGFTSVGYTKQEIEKNIQEIKERENLFAVKDLGSEKVQEVKKSKKIATMAEIALEYGVSDLGWYGENVKIRPTSKFDDIKRGVDDLLEIKKKTLETSFMGLAIDVTYRGLHSEQYKQKFFTLLKSISSGYKTNVKYHTNDNGVMMKEFAVPKIILYFNFSDVKSLIHMLKNIDIPEIKEQLKNHPQKYAVMNQIITQSKKLIGFSKDFGNDISQGYSDILSAINELAEEDKDIQTMLSVQHNDEVSLHLDQLINEFKTMYINTQAA